jgi:tRNA pseudouridine32 synthase/23S rRNA pseudouridine746 synthase
MTPAIPLGRGVELPVLFEDRWLLAVNKPAGWLVATETWERTRRNLIRTLLNGIDHRAYWALSRGLRFLKNVHRLDAPTTGVLLLAKNKQIVLRMNKAFRRRKIEKVYFAVVAGTPKLKQFEIGLPIAPHPKRAGKMVIDRKAGKPCLTRVEVLRCQDDLALLRLSPLTGRTHQLRLHLAAVGLPIVGDALYNDGREEDRLQLHASELGFTHPVTGKPIRIVAPLPADFLMKVL